MNLTDSRTIDADLPMVWDALLDADVLKACIPGCSEMTGTAESGFDATIEQRIGPMKAAFRGRITIGDRVEHESLTIAGGHRRGAPRGIATVRLRPEGTGTVLDYDVEVKIGGRLAQLGSRVIDSVAKRMADQFFRDFQATVEPAPPAGTVAKKGLLDRFRNA